LLRLNRAETATAARFAVVGACNTGVDFAVFSLLFYIFDAPLLVANTIAYLLAVSNSFVLNKYWTFAKTCQAGRIEQQISRFLLLGLVGLALSNIVVWRLAVYLPEIVAKMLAVVVLFAWNFGTSRLLVFKVRAPAAHR
jgi:putative flippase GtrA